MRRSPVAVPMHRRPLATPSMPATGGTDTPVITPEAPRMAPPSARLRRPSAPLQRSAAATSRLPASPEARRADAADATHDTAFSIGWDHARHGLVPPLERLCINPQLQHGYRAGRAACGAQPQPATAAVRRWLELRLHALAHGRSYETVQLTPHYLSQLVVTHCPVTRERLTTGEGSADTDAVIERLRDDAGYAAGHLAMFSRRALHATAGLDTAARGRRWREARSQEAAQPGTLVAPAGLRAAAWGRAAVLASFVTPLPHRDAAAIPMLLLPPNRLRLFNPVQALQALATRALAHETPTRQLAALRDALPADARAGFDGWLAAINARLDAGLARRPADLVRWALEDAWQDARVLARWRRMARALTAVQCEAIVARCGGSQVACLPEALATDGWALATGGYLRPRSPRVPAGKLRGKPTPDGIGLEPDETEPPLRPVYPVRPLSPQWPPQGQPKAEPETTEQLPLFPAG